MKKVASATFFLRLHVFFGVERLRRSKNRKSKCPLRRVHPFDRYESM
jgi:hypothetical protein